MSELYKEGDLVLHRINEQGLAVPVKISKDQQAIFAQFASAVIASAEEADTVPYRIPTVY